MMGNTVGCGASHSRRVCSLAYSIRLQLDLGFLLDTASFFQESTIVEIVSADEARAVALLGHDVGVTIGTGHENVIRSEASTRRAFFNEPDTIDVDSDRYVEKVVEEVQQYFHDCFVDTTWPECPLHRRHPLWMHDGNWVCEQSQIIVARLGELRASHDSAGQYVITLDP
jgi:hypothetical protein